MTMFARKIILMLVIIVPLCFQSVLFSSITLDDPFIAYRYSKNIVAGEGFSWNPGEKPVEGYTSFLWVLINAGSIASGIHPLIFSKIIGLLSAIAMIVLILRSEIIPLPWETRIITGFLVSACPAIAFYGQTGMETMPFALVVLLASLYYLKFLDRGNGWFGYRIASLLWGVSSLLRPEGVGYFGVMAICEIYRSIRSKTKSKELSHLVVNSIPFFVIWGPYYTWRLWFYGHLFPNTFYAKCTGGGMHQLYMGILYLSRGIGWYLGIPLAFIIAVIMLERIFLKEGKGRIKNNDSTRYFFSMVAFTALYVVLVGGDDVAALFSTRLLVPILPLVYLFFGVGFMTAGDVSKKFNAIMGITLGLLICFAWMPDQVSLLKTCIPNVNVCQPPAAVVKSFAGSLKETHQPPEYISWLKEQAPQRGTIATRAPGEISYYTDFRVLDLLGLNDEHIAHLPKPQGGNAVKMDPEYILNSKPDFIVILAVKRKTLGTLSFEEAGGWRLGEKELLRLLLNSKEYTLAEGVPGDIIIFKKTQILLPGNKK